MTDTPAKDGLIKKAWDRWFDEDYSWEGLKDKEWRDGLTLQDYWLSDPETGEPRSEDDLRASGELIEDGQKTYHNAHLPLKYKHGTPTRKTTDTDEVQAQLQSLIEDRLLAAAPISEDEDKISEDEEEISDYRAQLQGIVTLRLDMFEQLFNVDIENSIFKGDTIFYNASFIAMTPNFKSNNHVDFCSLI